MKYKAIIFDIDGTLIDNEKQVICSLQKLLETITPKKYSYEDLLFVLGIPGEKVLSILGIENREQALERWYEIHHSYSYMEQIFPGIREMLEELKNTGVRLGIVTSRIRNECDKFLEQYQFTDYFEASTCSGETLHSKPAPDPLLAVLDKMQVSPSEALYVGDSIYDMECAASAGVDNALALWGACQPEKITCRYKLENPADVLSL